MIRNLIAGLGSLKVTVICLSTAAILVFVGTMAQVHEGLYQAQSRYFRSLLVFWNLPGTGLHIPVLPGGYLVGGFLAVNLMVAQAMRWQSSLKNAGLLVVHAGILFLLLGQFTTDFWQVESHMRLTEGQALSYSENDRYNEVAIIDTSATNYDQVVAIPETRLGTGREFRDPHLPFVVKVKNYYVNSRLGDRSPQDKVLPSASQGAGAHLNLKPVAATTRMDERNIPAAILEFDGAQGSLGTWLVSLQLNESQTLKVGEKTFTLVMRPERYYRNHSIELLKFRHDKYMGTDIPKNFSSRVRVRNSVTGEDREVLIYMNSPLRYDGATYYQSGFDERDPRVSILQVVRNPGWLTPYLSCSMVGLGLLVHFMANLFQFLRQGRTA